MLLIYSPDSARLADRQRDCRFCIRHEQMPQAPSLSTKRQRSSRHAEMLSHRSQLPLLPSLGMMHCMKWLGQRLIARDFDHQVAEVQVRIAVMNGYPALCIAFTNAVR